jgi:serine/threonine protein kinase
VDPKKAEENAALVAREIVTRGFASQEASRQAYFEYVQLIRAQGVKGTFVQFLAARGVVDKTRLAALATRDSTTLSNSLTGSVRGGLPPVPPPASPSSDHDSLTVQISADAIAAQLAEAAERRPRSPAPEPLSPTVRFPPPPAPPAPTPAATTPPPPAFTPPPVAADRPTGPRTGRHPNPPSAPELDVPSSDEFDMSDVTVSSPTPAKAQATLHDPKVQHSSAEVTQDEAAQVRKMVAEASAASEDGDDEHEPEVPEVAFDSAEGLNESGEPSAGAKLGKFEIVAQVGRGGMAVVYRVKNSETGREYAMKVLTGGDRPGGEKRRARFRREVRAMRRLDHPNIVKIHDAGKSGPLDFYVMDLVEGEDFEKALEKNKYELEKRLEIVEGICRAMAHAHERGVIHRDLKPQNVLLDIRTKPKVVDFGLAKVTNDEVSLTRTNTALGTPFYMAPEQHKNAKHIDQRADVWALGCIIYECATGQRPFTGDTAAEVGHKVLTLDPPLPSKVRQGIKLPGAIDAIVVKALEKDPTRRYASAGALLVDLIRARAGKSVSASGSLGVHAEIRRWVERNKAAVIGGGVVGGVLLPILLVLAFKGGGKPTKTVTPVVLRHETPEPAESPASTDVSPPAASPSPTPATEVKPSPAPSVAQVRPSPSPSSATVQPSPSPTPSPEATARPQTPLESARADLKFPDEPTDCGADAQVRALTPEQQRDFWNALDRLVDAPLGRGDLDAARDGLAKLPNDAEVATLHRLARDEIQHDLDLCAKLRRLVVERVRDDPRCLQSTEAFEGGGFKGGTPALVDGDLLEFRYTGGRSTVDALGLGTATLKRVLQKEPSGAKLALAVLELHRGEDAEPDLRDLGAAPPVVAHRLSWAKAGKEARATGLQLLEKDAAEEWRQIQESKTKTHAGNLEKLEARMDDFVKTYGRTESFRSRRADWLALARDSIPPDHLRLWVKADDKKKLSYDYHWHLEDKRHARDLEVWGRDPKSGFRADWTNAGVSIEDAIIAFPADDRLVYWSKVEFTSEDNSPVELLAGDMRIDLDPKTEWSWKDSGEAVLKHDKSRKWSLNSTHALELVRGEEKEPKFTGHLGREDLFLQVPAGKVQGLQVARNRVGLSADRARVVDVEASIAKLPGKDKILETRYHQRYLLESRAQALKKVARVAATPLGARDLVLDGDWKVTSNGLEGSGPAILTTVRDFADGEASFEVQPDDGPGVSVEVGSAGWRLPSSTLTQPAFRSVLIDFDVAKNGGAATCVLDDALRLEMRSKLSISRTPLRIMLIDRTHAIIRNLRVVEFSRR